VGPLRRRLRLRPRSVRPPGHRPDRDVMRDASFGFHKPAYEDLARGLAFTPRFALRLFCG
jgi:hypothetical protein